MNVKMSVKMSQFKKIIILLLLSLQMTGCNPISEISSFFSKIFSKQQESSSTTTESTMNPQQPNNSTASDANSGADGATAPAAQPSASQAHFDFTTDASGLSKSTLVMKTSKGVIKFKLYSNDAPNSSKRFVELVQQNFYNGLFFHRVVPGFVIQTGDPKSVNKDDPAVGTGGSGQKQKAEFNSRKHVRGTVAMARSPDPDSADSQFYITMSPFPHLDRQYTVIGQVVDYGQKEGGKDTLDRIALWDNLQEITIE